VLFHHLNIHNNSKNKTIQMSIKQTNPNPQRERESMPSLMDFQQSQQFLFLSSFLSSSSCWNKKTSLHNVLWWFN
jgi:predicted RNA-binding protein with RPS1 domain